MPENPYYGSAPRYTFSGAERIVNATIRFIFYYRLVFVLIFLVVVFFVERRIFYTSEPVDRYKNVAMALTGASVIIAIAYSILNYEYIHIRFKHDNKKSKDTLTFTTACKSHEKDWIANMRTLKEFYNKNKHLLSDRRGKEVKDILDSDPEAKTAFIAVFNYFECMALGIDQGIMDQEFLKGFFKSMVIDLKNYFEPYFDYIRVENKSPNIYINFTNLAQKWN